ncbi:hypothetical protein NPIL_371031 [Nephila pilipes]|uniref:Uncharacterized protein n=1 Tax=Nephila pilipes TaxID=299642 RepID=A0A8X6TJ34_NEPPI|nr:hypothetical protein NPIL_371031 [Nephila pilipes]
MNPFRIGKREKAPEDCWTDFAFPLLAANLYLTSGPEDKVHPIKHDRTIHNDNSFAEWYSSLRDRVSTPCRIPLASYHPLLLSSFPPGLGGGFHVPVITAGNRSPSYYVESCTILSLGVTGQIEQEGSHGFKH